MSKKEEEPAIGLTEASERFELLAKATHDIIWDWNLTEQKIWWNEALQKLFGYSEEEILPSPDFWYDRIHPEDRERVLKHINELLEQGGENWSDHYRFRKADGTYAEVLDRGYTIKKEGVPVRMVGSMQDITREVQIQKEREQSEERLQFALNSAKLGTWELNPEKNTISWDDRCRELFGYHSGDVVDYQHSLLSIHPEDRERISNAVQKALTPGSGGVYDVQFRTIGVHNSQLRWLHCKGQAYFDDQGKPERFSGIVQDITSQMKDLEKLMLSDQQAAIAIEGTEAGSFVLTVETNEIAYSPSFVRILTGVETQSMPRPIIVNHIHPDDAHLRENAHKLASETGNLNYEARFIWENGAIRWVKVLGRYLYNNQGKAIHLSGIVLDVTDRMNYEQKLRANEEYLRSMIDHSPVAMALLRGQELVIETANNAFATLLGPLETIKGHPLTFSGEKTHPFVELPRKAFLDAQVYQAKEILIKSFDEGLTKDSYYDFTFSPIAAGDGTVSGVIATGIEVSQQVQARAALKESERRFRNLIEEAPVATSLFVGKDMIIDLPNEAMIRFWGKGPDVAGKPLREAVPELVGQPFLGILDEVFRTGETYHSDASPADLEVDGVMGTYYFDFTYKPLRNSDGEVYAILDMAVDVTSQVVARQELMQSEERYRQLANELDQRVQQRTIELHKANQELIHSNNNLQQFAYAASHDLQEPLRKIQSFGSRLHTMYSNQLDSTGVYMLDRIQDASKRMSYMIDDLLAYSRLSTRDNELELVNLNQVVANVLPDLEIAINEKRAEITTGELPLIWGNERQLGQLFQNLLGNAIKYSKPDTIPLITVSSRLAEPFETALIPSILPQTTYVRIAIADNGIGFDMKNVDRIFHMFQRLHGRSEYSGSGIGLALCKKVVQNHHGYITASSSPGNGSTFIIYLPLTGKPGQEPAENMD